MPRECDFEPMPRWQQNIYIIQDSEDCSDGAAGECKRYIEALVKRFQVEAQYNPDVDFNLLITEYQDAHTWGQSDMVTLDPDELSDVNISPSMIEHEQSVWDVISETISGTIRDLHSRGAISYPPIFIFVVNKGENLDFAKNGESALASNRYFLYSLAQNRRLIFCADSVWDDYSRSDWTSGPYEMDLIFPYRLFNDNVINYFMQIPRNSYQSGGLASDLLALHKSDCVDEVIVWDDLDVWED